MERNAVDGKGCGESASRDGAQGNPPAPSVLLTPLTPALSGAVSRVEAACLPEPWGEPAFLSMCRDGNYLCLTAIERESGEVCGFGAALAVLDTADITGLAVLPSFRRRGIASLLLSALTEGLTARGIKVLHLEVRESNASARALYEKAGFSVDGRRKNYYRRPQEDAVLMTKSL